MNFRDKTVLITGGSSGIGKAAAQRFQKEGANVIVFDIQGPDYDAEFHKVDVRNEDEIKKAFENIESLDILINNAGIYSQLSVEDTKKEDLDKIIDTNLKGTYLVSKYALSLLKESKGSIVNISSALGVAPESESPAYCSSKAGIIMLTKCMAQEYAGSVRVNAVLPGPIDTPMLRNVFSSEEELKKYEKLNPMRRIGTPEEVVNVILFLASEDASYVTGGLYSVDGGEGSSSLYSK